MISTRHELMLALSAYTSDYAEELQFSSMFQELLKSERCYHRDHLPGHVTGSAFIIDPTRTFTLLTHHAKLNRWLQPGGHADGDENIYAVAWREAEEETGLKQFKLLSDRLFDIDIHAIPARKDFPEHLHFDVRILLEASMDEQYVVTDESHDLRWVPLSQVSTLAKDASILRMVEKINH